MCYLQVYLKEQLIVQLEDKQRMIENERTSMELTGDSMELKPVITRKLRRRANEPTNGNGYSRYTLKLAKLRLCIDSPCKKTLTKNILTECTLDKQHPDQFYC